jgi:hypothetical protein
VTASFDTLAEADLPISLSELDLTDRERAALAGGKTDASETPLGWLLSVPTPPPSATGPSADDLRQLADLYAAVSGRVSSFVSGLATWDKLGESDRERFLDGLATLPDDACDRYVELQTQLAAEVPEWRTWAAAQQKIAALAAPPDDNAFPEEEPQESEAVDWEAVRDWYRQQLDQPMIDLDGAPSGVGSPTLREGYVPQSLSPLSGDHPLKVYNAIDRLQMLLRSDRSCREPIVVAGPTQGGKSTLLLMLAASGAGYRPILIESDPGGVVADIREAATLTVEEIAGRRPTWSSMLGGPANGRLVLLVDSLAGPIRGTEVYREISAFQVGLFDAGVPVNVVVTSTRETFEDFDETYRPNFYALEPFDESQLAHWVSTWNERNADYFRENRIEPLQLSAIAEHRSSVAIPGVLAMLARHDAIDNGWRRADPQERDILLRRWIAQRGPQAAVEYAGYVPDAPEGEDLLGIGDDVTTLTRVLLAEDASPPISVGLFGEWGTGKSFFMDKMRRIVDELAKAARQARLEGDSTGFCGEVRQITFNAWHYMDASLWATMADTIFDGLARDSGEDGGTSPAGRARILAELESVRLVRRELTRERDEAQRHLNAASASLREQPIGLVDVVRSEPVLRSATQLSAEVERKLTDRLTDAGLDEREVKELRALTALDTLRRIGVLFRRGTAMTRVVLGVALLIALLGLSGLVAAMVSRSTELIAWGLSSGGLVAALIIIQRRVARMQGVVKVAREIVEAVDEQRAAPIRAQRESLRRLIARYEEHIVAANARIELLSTGGSALAFAHIRHAAGDYKRHEGVVSLVRRDLEQLSRLMTDRRPGDPEGIPELERIILYVDDLDRCPVERVIEVLQAIHLLLAFPLFVVVVGVDLRWLLQAVRRHLRELAGDDTEYQASPYDYMEKIFQLPFCLQPMSGRGYERLIGQLVTVDPATRPDPSAPPDRQPGRDDIRRNADERPPTPQRNRSARKRSSRRLARYVEGGKPLSVALTRNGTAVVWIDDAGRIWSRDVRAGRTSLDPVSVGDPTHVFATSDGHLFVSQHGGHVLVIDGDTLQLRATLKASDPEESRVPAVVAALPDASAAIVAWTSADSPAQHSFVVVDNAATEAIPLSAPVRPAERVWLLAPDWRLVDQDGRTVLTTADGQKASDVPLFDKEIKSAVLADGGRHLAVIDAEDRVHAWRLDGRADQPPAPIVVAVPGARPADLLAMDGTGRLAAARASRIQVWNLATGAPADEVIVSSPVTSVSLAADGRRLVAACDDGSVEVWLVAAVRERRQPTASALRMTFGERDALIAVGGLIATPRAAKRMVNSYRLLRSGLGPRDRDHLMHSPREYGAIIVLLGLLVGSPAQGAVVLEQLLSLEAPSAGTLGELIKQQDHLAERLHAVIRAVNAPAEVEAYRHWAPLVARFSFRTGGLLQETR